MVNPDDLCPHSENLDANKASRGTTPMAPPIQLASVWACQSPEQANRILDGLEFGYVYQRERHPNGDAVAAKLAQLHGAEWGEMTGSGMASIAAVVLGFLQPQSRVVASSRLYGSTLTLLRNEATRFGVQCDIADSSDLPAFEEAIGDDAALVVIETISNPNLRVADIPRIAECCERAGAILMVDNTFATPIFCRPLDLGAHLVMESVSKMINGHSDVMLGFLGGADRFRHRLHEVIAIWGFNAPPFDCYLAGRGLATLAVRMAASLKNAIKLAAWLEEQAGVRAVDYPGLAKHADAEIASRVLTAPGSMLTFHLAGGRDAADRFIAAVADRIPFAPSLGEVCTTLSHPGTTSHRALGESERRQLGFDSGTIRLSVGVESADYLKDALADGLEVCR